jgi:hypothetical protein
VKGEKKLRHEENLGNPSKYVEFKGRKIYPIFSFKVERKKDFYIWYKRERERNNKNGGKNFGRRKVNGYYSG